MTAQAPKTTAKPLTVAKVRRVMADSALRLGKSSLDEAIECYRRSLAIRPSAEAHTFIGWAFSYQGKHEEGIAECRRAIAVKRIPAR